MRVPKAMRLLLGPALVLLLATSALPAPAGAAEQNDAGTGGDAGNTFDTATPLVPLGLYTGYLSGTTADRHDYYRFHADAGDPINIELRGVLDGGSLPAPDNNERFSFRLLSPQGVLLETPHTNQGDTRLMIAAAPAPGEYRFQVTRDGGGFTGSYTFCFLAAPPADHPCPDVGMRPQEFIWGGALRHTTTRVLVVPPAHGDLGNPLGPTVLDYLDATLAGIDEWVRVLHEFATDYPEYGYLKNINVQVAVFDGTQITTNYDIVISFVESGGTQFRGVAWTCANPPRCIVLSLYSVSPRAGQTLPDYPEYNDLEAVVKHEFAHVWGLGHTLTWTADHGPDLMNSPAPFVYGDGSSVGDGGERTGKKCISTLNLYGMAQLFSWIEGGGSFREGTYTLPSGMPYAWYC